MRTRKTPARLDREIAHALAQRRSRSRHHATLRDEWDVAMDAVLERDPERAAQIVRAIRAEHGGTAPEPAAFSDVVEAAPERVRRRFLELTEGEEDSVFRDAEVAAMFERRGDSDESLTEAVLGDDTLYTRRFRMPKWNREVTALDTSDVAVRYRDELGVPTSKHAHQQRAESLRDLKRRLERERTRLQREGDRRYGTFERGALISGGFHEHWPGDLKDKIRFLSHGLSKISDAIQLHQKLSKSRSPAFR